MVCSKAEGSVLSEPVQKVKNTRYYNEQVHRAALSSLSLLVCLSKKGGTFGQSLATALKQQKTPRVVQTL